jgi:hypothetical protein
VIDFLNASRPKYSNPPYWALGGQQPFDWESESNTVRNATHNSQTSNATFCTCSIGCTHAEVHKPVQSMSTSLVLLPLMPTSGSPTDTRRDQYSTMETYTTYVSGAMQCYGLMHERPKAMLRKHCAGNMALFLICNNLGEMWGSKNSTCASSVKQMPNTAWGAARSTHAGSCSTGFC